MEEEAEPVVEEEAEPIEDLLDTIEEEEQGAAEEIDITPPEDITNLMLSFKEQLEKFVITMNWTASINTAKDLVDQILYMSMDRGITYDGGKPLGPVVTSHQVPNLEGGQEYTFKVTTKDASGNESVGVVKSIRLPQTGFGAGILVLTSAAAAYQTLRRKKRKDVF